MPWGQGREHHTSSAGRHESDQILDPRLFRRWMEDGLPFTIDVVFQGPEPTFRALVFDHDEQCVWKSSAKVSHIKARQHAEGMATLYRGFGAQRRAGIRAPLV